jgi:threonine dehydrogenase-like Zn-dependent dehydrogenase
VASLALRQCTFILVIEPSPKRRMLASHFGAHLTCAPDYDWTPRLCLPDGAGRVVAFECSGRAGAIVALIHALPHGSAIQVAASSFNPEPITPVLPQWRQMTINFGHGPVDAPYDRTLANIGNGTIDAEALITGRVGLSDVGAAFAALGQPDNHVKILVTPAT